MNTGFLFSVIVNISLFGAFILNCISKRIWHCEALLCLFFIFYGHLFYLVFSYAFYSFIIQDKESINKRHLKKSEDFIRFSR